MQWGKIPYSPLDAREMIAETNPMMSSHGGACSSRLLIFFMLSQQCIIVHKSAFYLYLHSTSTISQGFQSSMTK